MPELFLPRKEATLFLWVECKAVIEYWRRLQDPPRIIVVQNTEIEHMAILVTDDRVKNQHVLIKIPAEEFP